MNESLVEPDSARADLAQYYLDEIAPVMAFERGFESGHDALAHTDQASRCRCSVLVLRGVE